MSKLIVVTAAVLVSFLTSPALAAGGLAGSTSTSLSDSMTLPGIQAWWSSRESAESCYASVSLNLQEHCVTSTNWFFMVSSEDASKWTAGFSALGDLLREDEPTSYITREQSGRVDRQGVSLTTRTSLGMNVVYYDPPSVYQSVYGEFWLSPATIGSTQFDYTEWKDPYRPGVMQWYTTLYVKGEFIASTLGEAQAMGAQFTPEPATICLFGLGVSALLLKRRR